MSAEHGNGDRPALTVREMVLDHDVKLDSLLTWRSEIRGALTLVRITLGTSIVGTIASVIAIVTALSDKAS